MVKNKKKTAQKKGQRTKKTPTKAPQPRANTEHPCVVDYAYSLVNPFDSPPSCVPISPALPSLRQKFWTKGTLSTSSSNGIGGITFAPRPVNNGIGTHSIVATEAAYNALVLPASGAAGTVDQYCNSPYPSSNFGIAAGLEWRVVSAGLRVRYIGSELNRQGRVLLLEEPGHLGLANYTVTDMLGLDRSRSEVVNRSWHTVTWQPVKGTEFNYQTDAGIQNHCLGIMIIGGLDHNYEYEAVVNVELIGQLARGKQNSFAFNETTSRIVAALGQVPFSDYKWLASKAAAASLAYVNNYYSPRNAQRFLTYTS